MLCLFVVFVWSCDGMQSIVPEGRRRQSLTQTDPEPLMMPELTTPLDDTLVANLLANPDVHGLQPLLNAIVDRVRAIPDVRSHPLFRKFEFLVREQPDVHINTPTKEDFVRLVRTLIEISCVRNKIRSTDPGVDKILQSIQKEISRVAGLTGMKVTEKH